MILTTMTMDYAHNAHSLVKIATAKKIAQVASMDLEQLQIVCVMILTSMTMEHVQHAQHLV